MSLASMTLVKGEENTPPDRDSKSLGSQAGSLDQGQSPQVLDFGWMG